ncbi:cache domain-containing protein [Nocardioides sp. GY 10127]|uniref:cache domain-containing protein n=1 Tax=Nocardioides sp. GY 10127 TaxID=2569762 RepID=UPI0010A8B0A4|nr:cache domain-containing protein [Nocardioides sp. GY 10127]TIC80874.1 hypothetical protein E8D37_13585 [Nocardioides sp. GY 10127]
MRAGTLASSPGTAERGEAVEACVAATLGYLEGVFARLDDVRTAVLDAVAEGTRTTGALDRAVRPAIDAVIDARPVAGAGFVAAPGLLRDADLHLAWRMRGPSGPMPSRGMPLGRDRFDYRRHEWFRVPTATGRRHVTGPYVDYVCTDALVVTTTAPVHMDGQVVGLVGADTLFDTVERLLLPSVRAAGAVLATDSGQVVLAADPVLASGDRLPRGLDEAPAVRVGDLPLRLLSPEHRPA